MPRVPLFLLGVRSAHAMENQALCIMKPQVSRIENYPEVAQKLKEHIRETEGQIQSLDGILNELGETVSSFKDAALSLGGSFAAIGPSVAGDEILRNSLANFAFENYEIAAYRSLMSLAENGGFTSALPAIQQDLSEEKAMESGNSHPQIRGAIGQRIENCFAGTNRVAKGRTSLMPKETFGISQEKSTIPLGGAEDGVRFDLRSPCVGFHA